MAKNKEITSELVEAYATVAGMNISDQKGIEVKNISQYDKAKVLIGYLAEGVAEYEAKVQAKLEKKLGKLKSYEEGGWLLKVSERTTKVATVPVEELAKKKSEFVKTEVKVSIDTKAVDDYLKKNGEMPKGIQLITTKTLKLERVSNG